MNDLVGKVSWAMLLFVGFARIAFAGGMENYPPISPALNREMDGELHDVPLIDPALPQRAVSLRVRSEPIYPRYELCNGIGGNVRVILSIDEAGNVTDASVQKSSRSRGLDRAAVRAVRNFKFDPEIRNGEPIPTHGAVPFEFFVDGNNKMSDCAELILNNEGGLTRDHFFAGEKILLRVKRAFHGGEKIRVLWTYLEDDGYGSDDYEAPLFEQYEETKEVQSSGVQTINFILATEKSWPSGSYDAEVHIGEELEARANFRLDPP
jgi:TonB family protein